MRYILTLTFLLFSIIGFAQKKIKEKDIYITEGKYYHNGIPLNGIYKVKFSKPNDHFSEIANYTNGIKNGNAQKLRFNKLEEEGNYINNKKEGIWKEYLYSTKSLEKISNYKNGIKEGLEIVFGPFSYTDSLFYINGVQDGIQIRNEKYKGRTETVYQNGTIISSESHDKDGNLKERCVYRGGKRCANYVRGYKGKQRVTYTDSIYTTKEIKTFKRYLNDSLQFHIKVKHEGNLYILYYLENKLHMLDEILVYKPRFYMNSVFDSVCQSIDNTLNENLFLYNDFNRCSIYTIILDKCDYYIYRLNNDGRSFYKSKYHYFEGAGDILPGCVEDRQQNNVKLPNIGYDN